MKIKTFNQEPRELNITEWSDEDKAFIKPLNGFEQLVFNDYFLEFYSKEHSYEERIKAGFDAAKMALVTEDGKPLLSDEDYELIRTASLRPLFRMFSQTMQEINNKVESAKKN